MPMMEIIRHKTFAVAQKTAKSMKVFFHESFMVYGTRTTYAHDYIDAKNYKSELRSNRNYLTNHTKSKSSHYVYM